MYTKKKTIFYSLVLILFFIYGCSNRDISGKNIGEYLDKLTTSSTFNFTSIIDSQVDSFYVMQPYAYADLDKLNFNISKKLKNRLSNKASFDHFCVLIFIHDNQIVQLADIPRTCADFAEISPVLFSINQQFYLDDQRVVKLFYEN